MAQTLKFGNGTWATKKGSTLAYNDEDGNFKPLPFTATRSTSATRVNKEGLIEVVSNEVPRIDYTDSEDGVFLLEKAATNLVTYSEDFSQWDMSNTSYSPNQTISPDGTLNSAKIIPNTNNVKHYTYFQGAAMNNNQSWSIFVKAENYSNISITSGSISNGFEVKFDLSLGTVHSVQGAAYESSKIESIGNGWYRCSVISSRTSGSWLQIYVLDDSHNSIFQGDGTSGIYLWGGQTVNSSVTTSYIPTYGSSATRSAETASGSGNSEVFNSEQGVLFANIAANADDGNSRRITINDGSTSNRIIIEYSSISNRLSVYFVISSSNQVSFQYNMSDVTVYSKIAFKYKLNDFSLYVNGIKVLTDTVGNVFTQGTLNVIDLDNSNGNNPFYGKTKELAYYNEILTDLELETLTSYRTWEEMVKELNLNIIHNE